jgi:hypothetical protein
VAVGDDVVAGDHEVISWRVTVHWLLGGRRQVGRHQLAQMIRRDGEPCPGPARCPITANDRGPAITAAIPAARSPASACRRPRLSRGPGTRAGRSSRYWLRAAGMGKDVISGRESLVAAGGERENFHRFSRVSPATRRHAGHVTRSYDTAGHSLT